MVTKSSTLVIKLFWPVAKQRKYDGPFKIKVSCNPNEKYLHKNLRSFGTKERCQPPKCQLTNNRQVPFDCLNALVDFLVITSSG